MREGQENFVGHTYFTMTGGLWQRHMQHANARPFADSPTQGVNTGESARNVSS